MSRAGDELIRREATMMRDVGKIGAEALDRIAKGEAPDDAIRIAHDALERMKQRAVGISREGQAIPRDFWREVPCGHPPDPVAAWMRDPVAPVCHCGTMLDLQDGIEIEGAPGPCVPCQNCGCVVAVPPAPTHIDLIHCYPPGPERLIRRTQADDPAIGEQVRQGRASAVRISEPHTMADCPWSDD